MTVKTIATSEVIFRDDLYPRIRHDQNKVLEYAEHLDLLPPIEVNQHNELIDGFHRWTAHKRKNAKEIKVIVTKTASDNELLALAIQRNATHGLQLSQEDKKNLAVRFYAAKTHDKDALVALLAVSLRTVQGWVSDIDSLRREERRKQILDLWLRCYTAEEIGELVGLQETAAKEEIRELSAENATLRKAPKVHFSEPDWSPPIYNVWAFGKKTNETAHFGNTEQRITENLLYLYTEPFDIVVDPFGGGGATLDVCEKRMRRCWISDRKPAAGMEKRIRTLDICDELPPLNKRWSEVALTYLDPPYWKQAEGQYSKDKEDLANMPLDEFTEKIVGVVRRIAEKQSKGAVALIIQPTQWKAPERRFTDHVFDIIKGVGNKRLTLENRVSCPYACEQCNPQMVEWAKENKTLLVLSRELIVWRL